MTFPRRDLVVVEVTTTGPDPTHDAVIDICAINVHTGRSWAIALPVNELAVARADESFLVRGGFTSEGLLARCVVDDSLVEDQLDELSDVLRGSTLGGAYPQMTAAFVYTLLTTRGLSAGWHFHLAELGALTAGAWGLPPTAIPSLAECARLWEVELSDTTTANGSAETAARCFAKLIEASTLNNLR